VKRAHLAGGVVTALAVAAGLAIGASRRSHAEDARAPLAIPRAAGPIVIDGHLDEAGWTRRTARTNAFTGARGGPGRPYADARLAWDERTLYVALYAADHDVRASSATHDGPLWHAGDEFRLTLVTDDGERVLEVSPSCVVTDARRAAGGALDFAWESGARAACDVDGTVNDSKDDDEEWVVELAIPLASLGGGLRAIGVRRCDAERDGARTCTSWHDDAPWPVVLDAAR
jgi:hypothetical protein